MSRRNEVVREEVAETVRCGLWLRTRSRGAHFDDRVLHFRRYLELMTVLQEQHSGLKDIHLHKLFSSKPRSSFAPRELHRSVGIDSWFLKCAQGIR